jgi:uncharacterized membrane protein
MDKMPIISVLLQGIPESIVLFSFGIAIMGEYINIKKVLLVSVVYTFMIMSIRSIVPVFGLHTVIALFIIAIIYWKVIGIEIKKSILTTILSVSTLILLETIMIPIIFNLFDTNYSQALNSEIQRILCPLPVIMSFGLITFIIYKFNWSLIKGRRTKFNDV